MSDIRFSVVIPTRQRHETLQYALKTCLAQQFASYEIVVCDNCSSPDTREIVERFASARIRYVRSDTPLAMSANWELAISHARGEYVMVIGDDDGLLLHALSHLDRLLKEFEAKLIRWDRIYYSWPNIPVAEAANELRIPLSGGRRILRGREVISRVIGGKDNYTTLPMLYNSAIHRDVISLLRSKTGRVFSASAPDVYSGFAFAYLAQTYLSLGHPMSINAGSAASNGVASIALKGKSPIAQEFRRLNDQAGFGQHPQIPSVPTIAATIANAFQHAKDALFPDEMDLQLDRRRLARDCVRQLEADSAEEWGGALQAIRAALSDDAGLREWFDREYMRLSFHRSPKHRRSLRKVFDGRYLHLDAAEYGVSDVLGVAQLYEELFASQTPGQVSLWRTLISVANILMKRARK